MERDRLRVEEPGEDEDSEEEQDEYIMPQMSYCCGSRGIDISPKFKDPRTRCVFVALAFIVKLVQLTFIAFVIYDLSADGRGQMKFNITPLTAKQIQPFWWTLFIAGAVVMIVYSCARCSGAGRGFCKALFLNIVQTLGVAVFCGALISTTTFYPYRYLILGTVLVILLLCLGICLLTTIFEMDVLGRAMYSALFVYFILLFCFAHFIYVAKLRETYKLPYFTFFTYLAAPGGLGFFIGLLMFWYIQELMLGRVVSLNENEWMYVNLLM